MNLKQQNAQNKDKNELFDRYQIWFCIFVTLFITIV